MPPDRFHQLFRCLQHLVVREAQHGPAQGFKRRLPQSVAFDHIFEQMHRSIDLNYEPQGVTGEIGIVGSDGVLTPELVTVELAAAQPGPDAVLGEPGGLAQGACPIASLPEAQALSQRERD